MVRASLVVLCMLFAGIATAQQKMPDTTVVNNGKAFRVKQETTSPDWAGFVITANSERIQDTIFNDINGRITFVDFNADGYTDLLLWYRAENHPDYTWDNMFNELYLFEPSTNTFKDVPGFYTVSNAKPLNDNPKVFYSFLSTGCDASDWTSSLFTIENYNIISYGYMDVFGCEVAKKEILVFKTPGKDEEYNPDIIEASDDYDINGFKIIDKPDYNKNIPDHSNRVTFVDNYWNENWGKFVVTNTGTNK